eukprot:TRINITY_DN22790_c0_g1_i3.p1 TRINITY_DN22790_c0_g1~~TRINITY_DN22790_c0_g1_i3.p1  ORF type:complete len:230 (+),score=38.06 TRINITY_DN22790_c0_g1_i3:208-897(+)
MGGQKSRIRDSSPDRQLDATDSVAHKLVESLEQKGFHVDVFSATYDTPWLGQLEGKLGQSLKASVRTECPGSQDKNAHDVMQAAQDHAKNTSTTYRWVVMLRHDMKLKLDLGSVIVDRSPDNKFLFPFKMTKTFRWFEQRVPDTIQVFDGKFLEEFAKKMAPWPGEMIWMSTQAAIGRGHKFGFLVEYFADSDPFKYQNPLYMFTHRKEGPVAEQALAGAPESTLICPK